MEQRTFHRSWVLTAVFAAVILLVAVLMWSPEGGRFAVLIIAVNAAITWRQRLVCSAEGLAVTNWRTQHVPWTQIRGFAPASSFSGGVQILTTSGQVWSPAPTSWWGGPAKPADLALIEQARPYGVGPKEHPPVI